MHILTNFQSKNNGKKGNTLLQCNIKSNSSQNIVKAMMKMSKLKSVNEKTKS